MVPTIDIEILAVKKVIYIADQYVLADLVTVRNGIEEEKRHVFSTGVWEQMNDRGYLKSETTLVV